STYQTHLSFFMPSPGYRFPDHTVHAFDGTFVERVPYRPKDGARPLVSLTAATLKPGWTLATPVTRASPNADGIHLVSDRSQYSYQIASTTTVVVPQRDYVLTYDITVVNGGFSVGVIDGDTGQWAAQISLAPGANAGRLYLSAPGAKAQVVVANCNAIATEST